MSLASEDRMRGRSRSGSRRLPSAPPFYEHLNRQLRKRGFDAFAESAGESLYAKVGRPGLPPGVYFRALPAGYFEGIDSERRISWQGPCRFFREKITDALLIHGTG
jgi:hypothetical protein